MHLGFDFDGTLACLRPGAPNQYGDPARRCLDSAALWGPTMWARIRVAQGDSLTIVSGRGREHEPLMRRWCSQFLGTAPEIVLRPRDVGLGCDAQAAWKATELTSRGLDCFVGDNPRIDGAAALQAHVNYVDVASLIAGNFPRQLGGDLGGRASGW